MSAARTLVLPVLAALVLPANAILDTNSNGISDLFEKQFNNNQLFDPGNAAHQPAADPDGDEWTNLVEASAGTNPFNANSPEGKVVPDVEPQTAPGTFIVSWPTRVGKAYQLQQSESLAGGSWIPIGPARLGDGQPIADLLQAEISGGGGTAPRMFYRVLVNDHDEDGDGLSNAEEHTLGLNPASTDSDSDGLPDKAEMLAGTNPLHTDSDLDGILDGVDGTPLSNNNTADPDGHLMPASISTDLVAWWDFQAAPSGAYPANFTNRPGSSGSYLLGLTSGGQSPLCIGGKGATNNTATVARADLGVLKSGSALLDSDRMTLNFWIQLPEGHLNIPSGQQSGPIVTLLSYAANQISNPTHEWRFLRSATGGTRFVLQYFQNGIAFDKGASNWNVPGKIDDGKWHHLTLNLGGGGGQTRMFLDGTQVGDAVTFALSIPNSAATNNGYMLVGGYKRIPLSGGTIAQPTSEFKGKLDSLMVHKRLLTAAEIRAIHQRDRDSDTLPDHLEARSLLWRDLDGNRSATANEYTYASDPDTWQSPATDSDQDGLSNTSEQLAGTDPFDPDTDGDLMLDAWEISNGLNPLEPADALLDSDTGGADGLTNLDEYRHGTDPKKRDTDGDGVTDGAEAKGPDGNLDTDDGSDPGDPEDGGSRRPVDQLVTFDLGVGDRSESHSEDYVLNVHRIDARTGAETRIYTLRSGGFGQYASSTRAFRKGDTYSFQIQWMGTNNATGSSALDSADWDYHMVVSPHGTDHGGILIDSFEPVNTASPIDPAHPILDPQDTTPQSDNDDNIADFPNTLQKKRVLFYTIRLHSVDRMFAAAVPVIPGLERMELRVTDTVTGKDFGTHGYLLGGGATRVYRTLAGMLGDEDSQGEDVTDPSVWFLAEANSRTTQFYLVSGKPGDAYGTIRVEASLGGVAMGAFQRTLVQNPSFANNIQLLTDIAAGVGLAFSDDPAIQDGQGILNPECWATPGLIPLMMIGHSVENLGIALQGIVYGVGAGLHDDWQFLVLCGKGIVQAGDWSIQQAQLAIQRWRSDPKGRLAELKETLRNAADELICRPLEGVQNRMSTSEGFISTVWEVAPFLNPVTGPTATAQALLNTKAGTDLSHKAAEGMVDWMYDFHSRMVDGAEKAAWLQTPLSTDSLTGPDLALVRTCAYGFGHTFGYLCEQVLVGAVTGGVAVVGKIVVKNGVKLTGKLAARTLAIVAARSTLLKRQLASVAMSIELRIAVEESLVIAARTPTLSGKPALEVMEHGFAGLGPARASMNWKVFLEGIEEMAFIRQLIQNPGMEARVWQQCARWFEVMGAEVSAGAVKGWMYAYNRCLKFDGAAFVEDRMEDLLTLFKASTPEGSVALKKSLEEFATTGGNGKLMVRDVEKIQQTGYRYSNFDPRFDAAGNPVVGPPKLAAHTGDGWYVGFEKIESSTTAVSRFQLPPESTAKFRLEFDWDAIRTNVKVPRGNQGQADFLEPLCRDYPGNGVGGGGQLLIDGVEVPIKEIWDISGATPTRIY